MMEGFLDFLLGDSEDAQLLRDIFVFKVRDLKLIASHLSYSIIMIITLVR